MKSSSAYYYLLRAFSALMLATPVLISAVFVGYFAGIFEIQGGGNTTTASALLAIGSSFLFAYLGWRGWWGVAVVSATPDSLSVRRGGTLSRYSWSEVDSVAEVPFFTPPLYRFTFRTGAPPAYCMCFSFFVATILWKSWDFTGFRRYCQEQLRAA